MLHSVHPDLNMSMKGMNVVNDLLGDFFEQVLQTAKQLMQKVGHRTLFVHDIAAAVALHLRGELHMFAMTQGLQALNLTADSYGLDTHHKKEKKSKKSVQSSKLDIL